MHMIVCRRRTAGRSTRHPDNMRVVDPEDPSSRGIVQRERVTNAIRTMFVRRHALRHDLHSEAAADLGEKAVEVEEPVETLVASAHLGNISDNDNNCRTRGRRLQHVTIRADERRFGVRQPRFPLVVITSDRLSIDRTRSVRRWGAGLQILSTDQKSKASNGRESDKASVVSYCRLTFSARCNASTLRRSLPYWSSSRQASCRRDRRWGRRLHEWRWCTRARSQRCGSCPCPSRCSAIH
jgi:hypothetical protein